MNTTSPPPLSVNDASKYVLGVLDMCKEAQELAQEQNKPDLASQFTFGFMAAQSLEDDVTGRQMRSSIMERADEIAEADKCFMPGPYYTLVNANVMAVRNNQREAFGAIHRAVMFAFEHRQRLDKADPEVAATWKNLLLKAFDAIYDLSATKEQKGNLYRRLTKEISPFVKKQDVIIRIAKEASQQWVRQKEQQMLSYKAKAKE